MQDNERGGKQTKEYKTQRYFVKDGDDYVPRRPPRRHNNNQHAIRITYKKCECGGKFKPRGAISADGRLSSKCTKCGKRTYTKNYRGRDGLARCY